MANEQVTQGADFWSQYGDEVLGTAEKAAAEAQIRSQFGLLTGENRYFKFVGSRDTGWGAEDIELSEYLERMKDKVLARSTGLEVIFTVHVSEMNPNLEWEWTRKVRVGSADWRKTLVPSIEVIYGAGAMGPQRRGATMGQLLGSYVEAQAVPQQPQRGDRHLNPETGDPYTTIRIAQVFPDKAACYAAYVAIFGEPKAELPDFPESYGDANTWQTIKEANIFPKIDEKRAAGMGEDGIVAVLATEFGVAPGFIKQALDEHLPL